jgi:hypothetical protein
LKGLSSAFVRCVAGPAPPRRSLGGAGTITWIVSRASAPPMAKAEP